METRETVLGILCELVETYREVEIWHSWGDYFLDGGDGMAEGVWHTIEDARANIDEMISEHEACEAEIESEVQK